MNILVYTLQDAFVVHGGIERVATVLGSYFSSDGHSVFYLSGSLEPLFLSAYLAEHHINIVLNHEGNDVVCTRRLHKVLHELRLPLISIYHFSPTHCIDLFKISWRDLLHSGLPAFSCLGLAIRNTPFYHSRQKRYFGRCLSEVYRLSDAVVLLSPKQKISYLEVTQITDCKHLFFIPNLLTLQPSLEFQKKKVILFVARLSFIEKRPDLLLRFWGKVCHKFPDWSLKIIGEGDYMPYMQRYVQKKKLQHVEFLGAVDAAFHYNSASIVCLTSNTEGFGLVLSEASAHHAIPICFDSFETASDIIVDGKTGFLITPFSIDQYAEKMELLMKDDSLRFQMAEAAFQHVNKHFNPSLILDQWYQLFHRFL